MIDPDTDVKTAYLATTPARIRAMEALQKNIKTNRAREAAGHPPVPCQLSGEEVEAIHCGMHVLAAIALAQHFGKFFGGGNEG